MLQEICMVSLVFQFTVSLKNVVDDLCVFFFFKSFSFNVVLYFILRLLGET